MLNQQEKEMSWKHGKVEGVVFWLFGWGVFLFATFSRHFFPDITHDVAHELNSVAILSLIAGHHKLAH
jgi:hypothetical protein